MKKFRLDQKSNPDLYDDQVQCSIHKQIKPTGEQAIVMSDFFTFFFNHLGCLFNYKDHFHFHKNNTFKCHHIIKKIAT